MLIVLSGDYNFLNQLKVSVILSYGARGVCSHLSIITSHLKEPAQVAKHLRRLVALAEASQETHYPQGSSHRL